MSAAVRDFTPASTITVAANVFHDTWPGGVLPPLAAGVALYLKVIVLLVTAVHSQIPLYEVLVCPLTA